MRRLPRRELLGGGGRGVCERVRELPQRLVLARRERRGCCLHVQCGECWWGAGAGGDEVLCGRYVGVKRERGSCFCLRRRQCLHQRLRGR